MLLEILREELPMVSDLDLSPVVAMTASFRRMWVQLQGDLKDAALELGIWSMPQHVSGKQHVLLGL